MGLCAYDVLFRPVFMVQAAKDRTRHHTAMCRQLMPPFMKWSRQRRKRLGNTRPQSHVRATCIVMAYPAFQKPSQVSSREGNHEVQAIMYPEIWVVHSM